MDRDERSRCLPVLGDTIGQLPAQLDRHPPAHTPRVFKKTMPETTPPVVFFSHAAADRALVERLATDLIAQGLDVWYSEWEIGIGDSLRRRIDIGIDSATHFLVLLSPASLQSEWVQTELDAGMVNKIGGTCKLLPILHEIEASQVPATLRGLKWVRIAPYEQGLSALVDACHGVSRKPSLGVPPGWADERPLPESGLSGHAQRLLVYLNNRSELGLDLDYVETDELLLELAITARQLGHAGSELEDLGFVELMKTFGCGEAGFSSLAATSALFIATDDALKGWNTERDARALAATLVNMGEDYASLSGADETLQWGPRRINPAAAYLAMFDHVRPLREMGSHPYLFGAVGVTFRTQRFADS